MTDKQQVGRIALRVEGDFWNAYYAEANTMKGAILLGSLRMSVAQIPQHKTAFMSLMRDVVAGIIHAAIGERPIWDRPRTAPEHEKGGST